jgi:hypothetical protein
VAKKRTDKSRYPSKYAPKGWVTPAQYIIEMICEKKALSEGRALSLQFWNNEEWAKFFKEQTRQANGLLKHYSDKAIIRALQDRRTKTTYSLRAPWLLPIIQEYQKVVEAEDKRIAEAKPTEVMSPSTNNTNIRVAPVKKTALSKLRDLDGQEES